MKTQLLLSALGSAALLAGCQTAPKNAGDPYAAAIYTGATQIDLADYYAGVDAPQSASQNGMPFELASYAGIDGARRAHLLYTEEEAEALDGRCERYVEASASESLVDVANLCDVSLETLVAYNPDVGADYAGGAVIEIPGGALAPEGAFAMSDDLANLYPVQSGDTLEKIAWRLDASAAAIANLNPDVYWGDLAPGQLIRRPVASPVYEAGQSYAPPAPWTGYGAAGLGGSDAGSAMGSTPHAPYLLKPVKSYARPAGIYPDSRLIVDRPAVRVGDRVQVTAQATSGANVTFYIGDEPGEMRKSRTVRAGEDGKATASIRVRKRSNMGGVVFGARPEGAAETQYSDRVNVLELDGPSAADDEDKSAD